MKEFIRPAIAAFVLLLITSCSVSDSPSKSAKNFLNAFNSKKFDEARKYATPETNKLIDLMESLSKMSNSSDSISGGDFEVFDEKIEGDEATVSFREKGSQESETIKLKKIDDKWLVNITKTDIAAKDNGYFDTSDEGLMETDNDSISNELLPDDITGEDE